MSSTKVIAILVAAGQGERLANLTGDTPKQFIELNQTPLFIWSLTTLAEHPAIEKVLVTVPEAWLERAGQLIADFLLPFKNKITIICGGDTRQQSVHIALENLAGNENLPTDVLVHDAVRPFITKKIIDLILKELERSNATTLGLSLSDSIKEVNEGKVIEDLDRSQFILVQTPQAAKFSLMLAAHRQAKLQQKQNTDDASIIKAYGANVTVVAGNKLNFKITEPEDLLIASALIKHYNWHAGKIET